MKNNKKIFIWSHADMDGCGCILLLKWLLEPLGFDVEYKITTIKNFKQDYLKWCESDSLYANVYICDLDIHECKDLVDKDKYVIIDHHETHTTKYEKAKFKIENYPSASMLIYDKFYNDTYRKLLSKFQLVLIKLIDDYDSYTLKFEQSSKLNNVFWSLGGNRADTFIKKYFQGFKGFDKFDKDILNTYESKFNNFVNNMTIYEGVLTIDHNDYNVGAIIATEMIDDLSNYMLKQKYDLVIIVNTKIESVSFRKQRDCKLNLSELASRFGGGGHEYAAGCPINDNIMKVLTKLHNKNK